jgi:NADH-quinone oxidoreductase subunit J
MNESLMLSPLFFFPAATFITVMAMGVLFSNRPIQALLYLVFTMISTGLLFMVQGAIFLGGVQIAVYAGAVLVLFLIILMLVNLDEETDHFFKEKPSLTKFAQVGSAGIILGLTMGALSLKTYTSSYSSKESIMENTKYLAFTLFEKHMFLFELVGVLLLVIAVGVVTVSRHKGGSK